MEVNQTHANDGTSTFATVWSKVELIVLLTKQLSLLLHEANVHQRRAAVRIGTDEVVGTPSFIQRRYERTSVNARINNNQYLILMNEETREVHC